MAAFVFYGGGSLCRPHTGAGEPLPPVNNMLPTALPHRLPQTGLAPTPSRDAYFTPPARLPSMPPVVGIPGSWPPAAPASAPVGLPMPLPSPMSMGVHRGVGLSKLGMFPTPPPASASPVSGAPPAAFPAGPSMAYAHRLPPVRTPAAPPAGPHPLLGRSPLPLPLPLSHHVSSVTSPPPVVGGHPLLRPPASNALDRPVDGARPVANRRPSPRADSRVGLPALSRPRVPNTTLPPGPTVSPPRRPSVPRSEAEERRDLGAKEAVKAAKKRDHRPPVPVRSPQPQPGMAVASAEPNRKGVPSRARTPLGAAAVTGAPTVPAKLPPRPPSSAGVSADLSVDGSKATDTAPAVTTPAVPRKPRKPYTITKARECWSAEEHHRFLRALELYSRDWKRIEAHVRTKTVLQIRSHAQKHFYKVQKNKTGEYVPPARIKRRPNSASAGASMAASGAASGAGSESVPAVGCSTSSYDATAVPGDGGLSRVTGSSPSERARGRSVLGSGAGGGLAAAAAAAAIAAASSAGPASGAVAEGHSGEGRPFVDSGTDRTRTAAGRQQSSSGDDGGSGRSNNSQTYQPKDGRPTGASGVMADAAVEAAGQSAGVGNGAGNGVGSGADVTVDPFVAGAAAAVAAAAASASAGAGSVPSPFAPYSQVHSVPSTAMAGALSAHTAWLAAAHAQQGVAPPALPGVASHLCPPPMYGAGGPSMYCMPPPWMPSYAPSAFTSPPPAPPGGAFPMYPMAWPQYYPHPAMAAAMAAAAYGTAPRPELSMSPGGLGVSAAGQAPFVNDNHAAVALGASGAGPVSAPELSEQLHVSRSAAATEAAGAQARLDVAPVPSPVETGRVGSGSADGFPVGVPAEGWATAAASRRAHRARVLRALKSRAATAGGAAEDALVSERPLPAQAAGGSAHDGGVGRRPRGLTPSGALYFGTVAASGTGGATVRGAAVAGAAQRSAAVPAEDSGGDSMDGSGSGGDSLIGSHTSVEVAPGGSDDTARGCRDDPPSDGVFGRSSSPPSAVARPRSSLPVGGRPSGVPLGTGSPDILARAVGTARLDHGSDGSGSPGGRAGQSSSGQRGGGSSDPASGGSTYAGSSRGNSRELASPRIGGPRPPAGPGAPRGGGGGSGSEDVGASTCRGSVGGSGGGTPPDGSEAGSPLCGKRPREAGAEGACGGAARRPPLSPHFHKQRAGVRPDARRERLAISWAALQQERDDAARGRPVAVVPVESEHVPESQLPTGALPYQLENRRAMR